MRFKKIREKINKSQKELAYELNLHQSSISQNESGIIFPSITTLNYLMDRYHISSNWLINGVGTMKIQDHDIVSLIRKGENLDERYINLLKQMQHPDIEKLIFARLLEAEVYTKYIKPENKS